MEKLFEKFKMNEEIFLTLKEDIVSYCYHIIVLSST